MRLLVVIWDGIAFLCEAYVKASERVDQRMIAKLKIRVRDIAQKRVVTRGKL